MASSKLMASSTSRNSDLIRQRRPSTVTSRNFEPMTVDGLLRNTYVDNSGAGPPPPPPPSESTLLEAVDAAGAVTAISDADAAAGRQELVRSSSYSGSKTVDEVWKEIVAGRSCKQEVPNEMMTLEDFLAKAGAVDEEDVKVVPQPLPTERLSGGIYSYNSAPISGSMDSMVAFGNRVELIGGRGKRRPVLEPLDKIAQQRQRRMIKNRESAARSRERKQAYQVELESLAVKLEEEHEILLKEQAERTKERYKQLMENIIPVVEQRRPARKLRRVNSMEL